MASGKRTTQLLEELAGRKAPPLENCLSISFDTRRIARPSRLSRLLYECRPSKGGVLMILAVSPSEPRFPKVFKRAIESALAIREGRTTAEALSAVEPDDAPTLEHGRVTQAPFTVRNLTAAQEAFHA